MRILEDKRNEEMKSTNHQEKWGKEKLEWMKNEVKDGKYENKQQKMARELKNERMNESTSCSCH